MSDDERELLLALAEAVTELDASVTEAFYPDPTGVSAAMLDRINELRAAIWRLHWGFLRDAAASE